MTQYDNSLYGGTVFGLILPKDKGNIKAKKEYTRVYDKKETNFEHGGLCILDKAFDVKIKEVLNKDFTMTLKVPIYINNQPYKKYKYIEEENYIKVEDQVFIIRELSKNRTEENKIYTEIFCEHISYELLDFMFEYTEFINVSPRYVLDQIFLNTPFQVQFMDEFGNIDFFWSETDNSKAAFMQLIEQIEAEFAFDNYNCYVYKKRGQDGVTFRIGKNIKRISEDKSSKDIVTRLYVYGKDGLGIESVNGGLPYIDSQYINYYKHPKCDKINFTDIDDPQKLLEKGQDALLEIEKSKVVYDMNVIDLSKIYPRKKVVLGDTCPIFDEKLEIDLTSRVTEIEYYPYNFEASRVILGDYQDLLSSGIVDFDETKYIVDSMKNKGAITSKNTISAKWLSDAIDAATNAILAGGGYVKTDGRGILVLDNKDELLAQKVIRINEEGIGISITGINGPFTNAMTGEGINASVINAGEIKTSLVKIFGDTYFYWDTNGIYIQNPSNNQEYIKIDKDGIRFTVDGGNAWVINIGFGGTDNVATKEYVDSNALQSGTQYNGVSITPERGIVAAYEGSDSETILDGDSLKRKIKSSGNVYTYIALDYAGEATAPGYKSVISGNPIPSDTELDNEGIGIMWVTIPNPDFQGRNFKVIPSFTGMGSIKSSGTDTSTMDIDVRILEYDYANARFKIRARVHTEIRYDYYYDNYYKGCKFSYYAFATD